MIIDVEIQGVPCQVRVTHYVPGQEPHLSGHPDSWEPGYPPEIEFEVLDSNGRRDPALERQMDDADTRTVEQEAIAAMDEMQQAERDQAAIDRYVDSLDNRYTGAW